MTKRVIINDKTADVCILIFRVVELTLGRTPDESIEIALDKRFMTKGVLKDGYVINYKERFQYGEDMLDSGKWGIEITKDIGDFRDLSRKLCLSIKFFHKHLLQFIQCSLN